MPIHYQEYDSKGFIVKTEREGINMVITSRISAAELREKYDVLIGWGVGRNEYIRKYNPFLFPMDYMIDINKELEGKTICGMKVSNTDILEKVADNHVCFIVFPNIEQSVEQEVSKYVKNYDIVVSALIELGGGKRFYSECGEDLLFMQMIDKLGLKNPSYLDIGVCHPVIRNNTYMLYEHGYRKGVLVEPNPDMCRLIREYRPGNVLLNMGACADESQSLKYYISSNPSMMGHNTFSEEAGKCGFTNYLTIPVANINHIIETYCSGTLDILDLDAEGMDGSLISALDTERYRIKMICVETVICGNDLVGKVLGEKGYVHFASTGNNGIYLAKELLAGVY